MKLSLVIQVFNGGEYWRECWQSVIENIDVFDHIFVSISSSPLQEIDIEIVQSYCSEKIQLLTHKNSMTAVEHLRKIDEWIASSDLEGHVFLLCHDDLLLREGLLKLKQMDLDENDAVFGSWTFFSSYQKSRSLTVRQFYRSDGQPWDKQSFIFLQDQQLYAMNISGVILPAEVYRKRYFPWHLGRYGARSEYLHLSAPCIKRIYQLPDPAVKIRGRSDSEGALLDRCSNQYDTLLYLSLAFEIAEKRNIRNFILHGIGNSVRENIKRGIWFLLKTQYLLWKNGYLASKTAWQIWCSLFFLSFRIFCRGLIFNFSRYLKHLARSKK